MKPVAIVVLACAGTAVVATGAKKAWDATQGFIAFLDETNNPSSKE